jgi:two-component system heavy metal sensor histidine kinase CusS
VIDADNKLLMETAGTPKELAALPFLKNTAFAQPQTMYWHSPDGIKYLLIKMATTDALKQKTWQVQVALDVSYHHYWLVQHRYIILFILLGGEIAAIFFGYLVARHGLRRMRDLLQTTKNITAQSLHQRIDVQSWPKELRELGQAFNAMLNRIETAFENMTQFSADLAHELRTPVNNMLGVTEIALSHHQHNPEYRSLLESNIEELQRISKIIENILFLAHTENPQLDLKKEVLDLENELALVSEYYRVLADDKNIKINIEGQAQVYANQLMLRRALSNILSNALKYSTGNIDCSIINDAHLVELSVSDKGMGIPADDLPKIFNRFYRVNHAQALRQSGNGLGLAIVKSIMKLHDGHIHINSIFGEGTLVTLCFINQTS